MKLAGFYNLRIPLNTNLQGFSQKSVLQAFFAAKCRNYTGWGAAGLRMQMGGLRSKIQFRDTLGVGLLHLERPANCVSNFNFLPHWAKRVFCSITDILVRVPPSCGDGVRGIRKRVPGRTLAFSQGEVLATNGGSHARFYLPYVVGGRFVNLSVFLVL